VRHELWCLTEKVPSWNKKTKSKCDITQNSGGHLLNNLDVSALVSINRFQSGSVFGKPSDQSASAKQSVDY